MSAKAKKDPMVIVAGHIEVEPEEREAHIEGFLEVVETAREAAGCLEFTIGADPIDPGRVNLFERWESQAAVKAFRKRAPRNRKAKAMPSGSVAEYDVADVRHLFGERSS
jgi:quinol monooxygenase YgiN